MKESLWSRWILIHNLDGFKELMSNLAEELQYFNAVVQPAQFPCIVYTQYIENHGFAPVFCFYNEASVLVDCMRGGKPDTVEKSQILVQ